MLRKRSRVTSKNQALMAECGSQQSPAEKYKRPSSSFFSSPRLFTGFTSKGVTDTESNMSPTSILDSKPFSAFKNPFWSDTVSHHTPKTPKPEVRTPWDQLDSGGVGLALVDALTHENSDSKISKPKSRMVLFGSELKIQIPPLPPSVLSPANSPKSPSDFGIKTRNSQLGPFSPAFSPASARKSPFGSSNFGLENPISPMVFSGCLSASEMELSEDYTCVISHGPNPRTTHIFDDCIVESCCGVVGFSPASQRRNEPVTNQSMSYPSETFLSFCYSCKKNLGQGRDIYMYRGEKAFCSSECRFKEIISDEGMETLDSDDVYGA
ncbi:hypothetical protein RJ640_011421 [Escallonia rubra]|uniref:FLZ-type domain-containing protein n=1 Tax=Escallonia rubra TaxID=112253 RepID=A0AA88R1I2_9ASTE|nr:hypothetical protein RJ640_011421 [Escallonia rubra]